MTYTLLNALFLLAAAAAAVVVFLTGRAAGAVSDPGATRPAVSDPAASHPSDPHPSGGAGRDTAGPAARRAWVLAHAPLVAGVVTLVILLVLTAVFDSVIVGVGLVAYDPSRILGWYVGRAPVEDLAYTVGAVLVLPAVWSLLGRRDRRRPSPAAPAVDPSPAPAGDPAPAPAGDPVADAPSEGAGER